MSGEAINARGAWATLQDGYASGWRYSSREIGNGERKDSRFFTAGAGPTIWGSPYLGDTAQR